MHEFRRLLGRLSNEIFLFVVGTLQLTIPNSTKYQPENSDRGAGT